MEGGRGRGEKKRERERERVTVCLGRNGSLKVSEEASVGILGRVVER
jgi:hypothetical protein